MAPPLTFLTQKKNPLSAEGWVTLLNQLHAPTLLVNLQAQVAALNARAEAICACPNRLRNGAPLGDLFPSLPDAESLKNIAERFAGKPFATILITHNKQRLPILLRVIELAGEKTLYLLTLEPAATSRQQNLEARRQADWLYNFERLLGAAREEKSLEDILAIGSKLLGADALALYLCEAHSPIFRKAVGWGNADVFPNDIPAVDFQHLIEPHLWPTSNRSVTTILHQAVRVAQYAYLASAPVGEIGAWTGVIAATGLLEPDSEHSLSLLRILAAAAALHIQKKQQIISLESHLSALNRQLVQAEALREAIQEGVIFVSPEFEILEINAAAEYILGYANHEIYKQPVENVLIGSDRLLPALHLAFQGVATPTLGTVSLHRRDGSSFPAQVQIAPTIQQGETFGALVILQDTSEHQQAKIRAHQLEQRALLGEVTAIFAHEVRNPINNLSTGLQLMALNTPPEDTQTQELITRLQHDCTRLTDLMESVLTFSRTGNYRFVPIEVHQVIERLLVRWHPRLKRLNIQHHLQFAPNSLPIVADQRALEQVFTNLISNAVRAMGENGGTLAIRIAPRRVPSGKIITQIDVSDTGAGISDEIRERIFDPFFTTDPNGTGLGLAITKQIITAHKGSIHFTSFPGGTVFHVQLPTLEAAEELIL